MNNNLYILRQHQELLDQIREIGEEFEDMIIHRTLQYGIEQNKDGVD